MEAHDDYSLALPSLEEADIKQAMLRYLKNYYRFRPRSEEYPLLAGIDVRGEGGIIADGFLSFYDDKHQRFFVAFEATSRATRQEIEFKTQWRLLGWDVGASTLFIIVAFWLILHAKRFYLVQQFGLLQGLGFLLLTALLVGVLLGFLLFRARRYRYIYAIEQFKQYFADDQWVAVGHDVFEEGTPRYFDELKRQCVRYGFGLVVINAERRPLLVLAPSQAEIIKSRRMLDFVAFSQVKNALGGLRRSGFVQKTRSRFNELIRPYQERYFKWFGRTYYHQWSVVLISLAGLALAFWHEYNQLPFRYVNERWYRTQLEELAKTTRPEPDYYLVDAPIAEFGQEDFEPFTVPQSEEQFDQLIQGVADMSGGAADGQPIRILAAEPGAWPVAYPDCSRFYLRDTTLYIIQDTVLSDLKNARSRLLDINAYGVSATAVWSGCFRNLQDGYILYVDQIYADSARAYRALDSIGNKLKGLGRPLSIKIVE